MPLTQEEHAIIAKRSQEDRRAQQLRELARVRHIEQLPLLSFEQRSGGGL